MTNFWIGFSTAIFCYFAIGASIGVYVVITNLARFHGGGFQWRRMALHVGVLTLIWPVAIAEMLEQ